MLVIHLALNVKVAVYANGAIIAELKKAGGI
jgi:hypothetical protein